VINHGSVSTPKQNGEGGKNVNKQQKKMEGFDDTGVFFSDNFSADDGRSDGVLNLNEVKKKFKDFLREFHEGNFNYKYR